MILLKQSTARTLLVGPFLDDGDGKTAETELTITQAEVRLSKNGGNMAQKHEGTSLGHDELGYYTCKFDTDDTDTLGILSLMIHESGALPVWQDYMVVPANVWDSLFSTDKLQVDLLQMGGVAQSATDLKDFADAGYDPETDKVNGVKLVDKTTENTDMVGTDGAATPGAEMDLVDGPNETAIATIVDGLALEATLTAIKGDEWSEETLVAIKAVLDAAAADVENIDGAAMVGTNGAALASAWTAARAAFIDKLNVAGTLAHSGAAATYKANVTALALEATLTAIKGDEWSDETLKAIHELIAALKNFDPASDEVDVGKVNGDDVDGVDDFKADVSNLDAKVSSRSSHTAANAAAAVWGATTRAITDKVGFSLSTAGIKAIWDQLTAALTTAGSIGKLLVDRLTPGSLVVFSPEFTGDAGLTYAQLKGSLKKILPQIFGAKRKEISPELVEQWINTGYQEILAELRWVKGTYEITTSDGITEYAIPNCLRDFLIVEFEDTDGKVKVLDEIRLDEYVQKRHDSTEEGTPRWLHRHGDTLYLYPTPDKGDETVRIYAVVEPDNLSEDEDKPGFPAHQHQLLIDMALAYACRQFGDLQTAAAMEAKVRAQLEHDRNAAAADRAGSGTIQNEAI